MVVPSTPSSKIKGYLHLLAHYGFCRPVRTLEQRFVPVLACSMLASWATSCMLGGAIQTKSKAMSSRSLKLELRWSQPVLMSKLKTVWPLRCISIERPASPECSFEKTLARCSCAQFVCEQTFLHGAYKCLNSLSVISFLTAPIR